ncbi:MAG TPA: hypothetical protein VFE84_05825 [Patescibacteria group bacterium]|jgi:succinate dehydrogenase/fumarate reductase cytochrome b subunit|nr:hypothetical protein [Patescibacteria group bacterium]
MIRRDDRLARCHAVSGLLIALYAALHLLNHAASMGGPAAFSTFRALLRHLYQSPVYEVGCLLLPLLFNCVTGLWMLARSSRANATPDATGHPGLRRRLHRWSGIVLAALVVPHALSTRGAALLWNIDPDFHFVARTLSGPRGAAFWLIYALLAAAASYHLSNGLFTFLDDVGALRGRVTRNVAAAAFIFVGATLMTCGFLGLLSYGGVIYQAPTVETLPPD